MINGYLDIPHSELEKYWTDAKKKKRVCDVIPRGRFYIQVDGRITYNGLVCKDIGGSSTGVGAESCRNCVLGQKEGKK